jgi:hypothetical protein
MDGESAPKGAKASASKSVHIALTIPMCSGIRFGGKIQDGEMSNERLASEIEVLPWMISMTSAALRLAVHLLMSSSIVILMAVFSNSMTCAGIQWVITRHAKGKTLRFKKSIFHKFVEAQKPSSQCSSSCWMAYFSINAASAGSYFEEIAQGFNEAVIYWKYLCHVDCWKFIGI